MTAGSYSFRELEAEALQLPVEDRGQLVARLLESLEPSEAEIQQLWIQEAERRADELRSGQVRSEIRRKRGKVASLTILFAERVLK